VATWLAGFTQTIRQALKKESQMNSPNSSPQQRPFALGLYLLVVFGLSWPFQIAGALYTDMLPRYILIATSMVMVTVGTFIAGRYMFRDGFAGAGWGWGKPKHYLAVVGLVLLQWVIPTSIRWILGSLGASDIDKTKIIWLFLLPCLTLIPGFGEEFGWRGYMLPRIAGRMSARKAVTLHAVIWWAWHLPVTTIGAAQAGVAGAATAGIPVALSIAVTVTFMIVLTAIPVMLHAILFAYIWLRSRSLAVATVYHAAYDGVRDSLGMVVGLTAGVSLWATVLTSILGIILLWKGDWSGLEGETTVE
jgi:membrane protease YdiL (CAAX protease family)